MHERHHTHDTDIISNTASVSAVNETLINPGDDTATESTSVTGVVDLIVTKTESVDPAVAGSGTANLTYEVMVINAGPSDASGVTLSEALVLPSGVTIDSVTPSGATSFADPTWTVGDLAAGADETLTVNLTVGSGTARGGDVISNTATVATANETLINTGDDSASVNTSVTVLGDLDGDCDVDFGDFSTLAANFTGTITPPAPPGTAGKTAAEGDGDGDGDVDFGDFAFLAANFTGTDALCGPAAAPRPVNLSSSVAFRAGPASNSSLHRDEPILPSSGPVRPEAGRPRLAAVWPRTPYRVDTAAHESRPSRVAWPSRSPNRPASLNLIPDHRGDEIHLLNLAKQAQINF